MPLLLARPVAQRLPSRSSLSPPSLIGQVIEAERLPAMSQLSRSADPYLLLVFEGCVARSHALRSTRSPRWPSASPRAFRLPVRHRGSNSRPSHPQPSHPQPSHPQSSHPQPSHPQPSHPQPSHPRRCSRPVFEPPFEQVRSPLSHVYVGLKDASRLADSGVKGDGNIGCAAWGPVPPHHTSRRLPHSHPAGARTAPGVSSSS
jgi:hypothetical protein